MLAFVSAFLGALFLIIIIAVQVVSTVYKDKYVKNNVLCATKQFWSINKHFVN